MRHYNFLVHTKHPWKMLWNSRWLALRSKSLHLYWFSIVNPTHIAINGCLARQSNASVSLMFCSLCSTYFSLTNMKSILLHWQTQIYVDRRASNDIPSCRNINRNAPFLPFETFWIHFFSLRMSSRTFLTLYLLTRCMQQKKKQITENKN